MRVLKLKKNISLWGIIIYTFLVYNQVNAVLRVAFDIPKSLSKSFANVRDSIISGYSSQHIFGMNHLIPEAITAENERRRIAKIEPLSRKFTLQEYNHIYLTFLYVDEPNSRASIRKIKRVLRVAVNEYKSMVYDTKFNFKVQKSALFVSRARTRLEIVQNVLVNKGLSNLDKLKIIIKKHFDKNNIKSSVLGLGFHVGYAKIKSQDHALIDLVRHDKKIENLLKSVRAPKGAGDGFDLPVPTKINLYDGLKRLANYDL